MNKKFLFNWALWIGIMNGIYCYIYSFLPFAVHNIMWMTFVALPIYFNGGAKREEYPHYVISMLTGVVWGKIYLYLIEAFSKTGVSLPINLFVIVGGITVACCAIHFILTSTTWMSKVPMMFGAISMTFSQGGDNLFTIICTLFGGLTLGLICQEGTKLIDSDGNWKFGGSNKNVTLFNTSF